MKAEEIRAKSGTELVKELVALKEELFKLRFQHATNQLENPQRIAAVKRDIARVNTIIREQELKSRK
jgi:large subunit ribosomal protein L29